MNVILIGGGVLVGLMVLYQLFRHAELRKLVRNMRWIVGGAAALVTGFLLLRGQIGVASITGYAAFSILRFGRLGPWSFESGQIGEDNRSAVRSRFISMTLDHDSGTVEGRVVSGAFRGADLTDLGEEDTRVLLSEVSIDPDSQALLETWLDKNRPGWREYFAGEEAQHESGAAAGSPVDADAEAYEVLGLEPGATAQQIREAHRKLMMGVHPDQGGSNYLATKINAAKDRLLKKAK